jgi:mannose-6-phosphate isomerase-like protein (cupin superfamily)
MQVFSLPDQQEFDLERHVEKILGTVGEGDVTIACWEPGQISPYHCHPQATEIYFCFQGGGKMTTPTGCADVTPGTFVVHPAGELHEFANGKKRTRTNMAARHLYWRGRPNWAQRPEDQEYFRAHPMAERAIR